MSEVLNTPDIQFTTLNLMLSDFFYYVPAPHLCLYGVQRDKFVFTS